MTEKLNIPFTILLSKTLKKQLVKLSKDRGVTQGEVVRQMIRRASARKGA